MLVELSWVDLVTAVSAQPVPKAAYHNGRGDKHNRLRWGSNLGSHTPLSRALTTRPLDNSAIKSVLNI